MTNVTSKTLIKLKAIFYLFLFIKKFIKQVIILVLWQKISL